MNYTACAAAVTLALLMASDCSAEIPKASAEELHAECSHAIAGNVVRTYTTRVQTSKNFEHTYGVAELIVEKVDKGQQITAGDRVYFRYWKKRWTGDGGPAPDHYGHWDGPKADDRVFVYVKGDRKTGYDVLSPNGFFRTLPDRTDRVNSEGGG